MCRESRQVAYFGGVTYYRHNRGKSPIFGGFVSFSYLCSIATELPPKIGHFVAILLL